jgi:8-oxo-dGTP pyrophosphatase MutT (NUDIX family)
MRAVGALIVSRKTKRALMQLRSVTSTYGMSWGLWGGKLIGNEGDLEGLKRELCEELGWPGVPDTLAISHIYTFVTRDKKFRHVSYLILCEDEFLPKLNKESAGFSWVDLYCWPNPVHRNTAKMFASQSFRSTLESIVYDKSTNS